VKNWVAGYIPFPFSSEPELGLSLWLNTRHGSWAPQDIASRELGPALQMMHPFLDVFVDMYDYCEPLADGVQSNVVISKSYDPTSHFETEIEDVLDMYKRITGKDLVLGPGLTPTMQ
jgi:hypothetical protein